MPSRFTIHPPGSPAPFTAGFGTMKQLTGVHPDMIACTLLSMRVSRQDFTIIDEGGLRSPKAARANARNGVGILESLHLPQGDGLGHAVDLVPFVNGRPTWERKYFPEIWCAWRFSRAVLGVVTQDGADWDSDGIPGEPNENDWPHKQLPRLAHRFEQAEELLWSDRHLLGTFHPKPFDLHHLFADFREAVLPGLRIVLK